ncbi:MAG: MutS family DNA mismatch repair protein, partial [Pseudomonadota bacterium]
FLDQMTKLQGFYEWQENFRSGILKPSRLPEEMSQVQLARDLDLGLFFSNIDSSFSVEGERRLDHWLCQDFGDTSLTWRKQSLKEILKHPGLLRKIQIQKKSEKIRLLAINEQISRPFVNKTPVKWLVPFSWFLLLGSLLVLGPHSLTKGLLIVYVGSVLFYIGQTKHVFSQIQDIVTDLSLLNSQLPLLEKLGASLSFTPQLKAKKGSKNLARLNQLISLMSVKANPLLFYLLNMVLPWDFLLSELSERQRRKIQLAFRDFSKECENLEALISLSNLSIYHETCWATFEDHSNLEFQNLSHPLLDQKTIVKNDFSSQSNQVIIITGSNMSGKSTFLRAVGLNLCLANMGAPVFAQSFSFRPLKIMSCIRVSDSLRDGQSYFYAEVLRMKEILIQAKKEPLLFLIDEPLRGTNNQERLVGNRQYLRQILETGASGFLSTHDLELTKLADDKEQIHNFHFSDRWHDQELRFDYKIKEGPSQTTNALKILEREGLYQPMG